MTNVASSLSSSSQYMLKLYERLQSEDASSSGTVAPASAANTSTIPSLASVLSSTDSTSGVGAQTASTVTSLMMDIQMLGNGQLPGAADGASASTQQQDAPDPSQLFSKLDTNNNGSLSLDEFLAGKPQGMSTDDATKLFNSIDAKGTGSITEDQFATSLKADEAAHGGKVHGGHHHHGGGRAAEAAANMFKQMDTDNNGSVTQAEFLAAKPGDMTDDQATQLFQAIDSSNSGSITQDQLTKYMQEQDQAKGASSSTQAGSGSSTENATLAQDLLKQLTQVIQNFNSSYVDGAASAAAADATAIG